MLSHRWKSEIAIKSALVFWKLAKTKEHGFSLKLITILDSKVIDNLTLHLETILQSNSAF